MKREIGKLLGMALFGVCLGAGCISFNQQKFDKQVEKWVPVGTPVEQARKIMEGKGFDCTLVGTDSPFNQTGGPACLECDRTGVWFHSWSAQLQLKDKKVSGYGPMTVK